MSDALLISTSLPNESAWPRYQWTLLDAEDDMIGRVESPYAFAPFAVSGQSLAFVASPFVRIEGDRLIEAQDLALVVMDMASGREAWQADLLDKAYREGMPP